MSRHDPIYEPGAHEIRQRWGIVQNDDRIFKPYTLNECLAAAELLSSDSAIQRNAKPVVRLGVVLDMMVGHLTPRRATLARRFKVKRSTLDELERRWELWDQGERMRLVMRAIRLVQADRLVGRQVP